MKRQLWSSWEEFLDVNKSDVKKRNGKPVIEETYVKKFEYSDRSMFGTYPSWDNFYLVNCKLCSKTIKPQDLKSHMERRHAYLEAPEQTKYAGNVGCSKSSWTIAEKPEKKGLKLLLRRQNNKNNYYNCHYYHPNEEKSHTRNASLMQERKSNIECSTSSDSQQSIAAQSPSLPSNKSMPSICSNQETPEIKHSSKMRKSKQYSILKDNQIVSSDIKSDVYETYSRPSSGCTLKMKKNGLLFDTNTDSVRQTDVKIVSLRKRKSEKSSKINAVFVPHNKSSTSNSSTNDTLKAHPFFMSKNSDFYCETNSHVTYPNRQIIPNKTISTKFETLNENIPEENQCITKSLLKAQVNQQLNDIYQLEPLQHDANMQFKSSYPSWEPPTDYSFDTSLPKNTDAEKISIHNLSSHLAARFDESQLLITKAAMGT